MDLEQLYEMLELPTVVVNELNAYEKSKKTNLEKQIKEMLLHRESWEEGVKELQKFVGDDADGMKILWEMLNMACESYKEYEKKKIPTKIFIDTMKFCTRFLNEHYHVYGQYKFVWAWWFPRQLTLQEFRIGDLEYEFIMSDEQVISVHIPSDADMCEDKVLESISAFYDFRKKFFTEWENVKICCDSWLLSPVLQEFLDEKSNIINFQKLFIVEYTDYESKGALDWVFPGYQNISEELPEHTSLQKKMKAHLLRGGKVGWSRGRLNEEYVNNKVKVRGKQYV